jgi:hypothetical protein
MHQKQPPAKVATLALSGTGAGDSAFTPMALPEAVSSETALFGAESPVAARPEAELPEHDTVTRSTKAASAKGILP